MPRPTPDSVPYPPGPDPEHFSTRLTKLPPGAWRQELLFLLGHLLFLGIYFGIVVGLTAVIVFAILQLPAESWWLNLLFASGILLAAAACFTLIKAFVRSPQAVSESDAHEVTAELQPRLFAFLQRVGDDVGCGLPRRVFLTAEPNASVQSQPHLCRAQSHHLTLGLGLVNAVNLGELQAVLAHELAHTSQHDAVAASSRSVQGIVKNLLDGRDGFDRWLTQRPALLAAILNAGPNLMRLIHRALRLTGRQLQRGREFHADAVAASIAGSNVVRRALEKMQLGLAAWERAEADLREAADRRVCSYDFFFHQHAAAAALAPNFVPIECDAGPHHPSFVERVERLERLDVPAPPDERTPWLLFENAAELRRTLTARLLRSWPNVPRSASLSDPRVVQGLIDAEHFEAGYDSKYGGAYDGRWLQLSPADLKQLLDSVRTEPWSEERIRRVRSDFDADVRPHVAKRAAVVGQRRRFLERLGTYHTLDRLDDYDHRLERIDAWFHAFDRRVALVHLQMAADPQKLAGHYRELFRIEELDRTAHRHAERVRFYSRQMPLTDAEAFVAAVAALRSGQAAVRKLAAVEPLVELFHEENLVDELPPGPVEEKWLAALQKQLDRGARRTARLHAECLASLLAFQESIAAEYSKIPITA